MNIYEKVQKIKVELLDCNLKKSGKNKFAGFEYYELSDIMPDIIRLCDKYKICTMISFDSDYAKLTAFNGERDDTDGRLVVITTPTATLEIKGSNAIQALGGMQTYMRRYLYMAMFDITENDTFDAVSGKTEKIKNQKPDAKKYCCEKCGTEFEPFNDPKTNKWCGASVAYDRIKEKYGTAICKACREKTNKKEG